jgi:hypothetical protein
MKIKWRVQEAATGPYRSFTRRGWPSGCGIGELECHNFLVYCDDEYIPALVKTGKHKPLTLTIDVTDWDSETGLRRVQLKRKLPTLKEAKAAAAKYVRENPDKFTGKGKF